MKRSKEFIKGVKWALNQIENKMPINCDPSDFNADLLYYIEEIREKLL